MLPTLKSLEHKRGQAYAIFSLIGFNYSKKILAAQFLLVIQIRLQLKAF